MPLPKHVGYRTILVRSDQTPVMQSILETRKIHASTTPHRQPSIPPISKNIFLSGCIVLYQEYLEVTQKQPNHKYTINIPSICQDKLSADWSPRNETVITCLIAFLDLPFMKALFITKYGDKPLLVGFTQL